MYEQELETAVAVVSDVCGLTHRVQEGIVAAGDAVTKGDRSPVTLADLAAQVIVSRRLGDQFVDDPLLAEEDSAALSATEGMAERVLEEVRFHLPTLSRDAMITALDRGDHQGGGEGRYWVLDPIDGTKGFLRGDQYAVALALVDGGRVVVGVLGCPNLPATADHASSDTGWLFGATRNDGAWGRVIGQEKKHETGVDSVIDPAQAVVCESVVAAHAAHSVQGRIAERLGIGTNPYRIDSQCKYAVVARGEASIYLRLPRDTSYREKVWDHAAGALIVEEAGGRVTDLNGHSLDFSQGRLLGNHRGIVCTNGAIHDQVLDAARAEMGG